MSANEEPLPPLDTAEPLAERGRAWACCPSARSTAALVAAAGPQAFSASSAVPPSTGERTRAPMMLSSHVGGGGSAGARPPWSHHMDAAAKDFVRLRILEVQRLFLTRDVSLCLAHAARAYHRTAPEAERSCIFTGLVSNRILPNSKPVFGWSGHALLYATFDSYGGRHKARRLAGALSTTAVRCSLGGTDRRPRMNSFISESSG